MSDLIATVVHRRPGIVQIMTSGARARDRLDFHAVLRSSRVSRKFGRN